MRTTTVACDRCKKSALAGSPEEKTLDLQAVCIAVIEPNRIYSYSSSVSQADLRAKAEWCKECREAVGITRFTAEEDKKPGEVPAPIETQLVELLRTFIVENTPQQS